VRAIWAIGTERVSSVPPGQRRAPRHPDTSHLVRFPPPPPLGSRRTPLRPTGSASWRRQFHREAAVVVGLL